MTIENESDRILFDLISKIGELEWRRYRKRYPTVWVDGHFETGTHPSSYPSTSFRFKDEDPKVIETLENALKSYRGKLQWTMIGQKKEYGPGVNRCILPIYIKELQDSIGEFNKVDEYVAKHKPDFGSLAYDDLINLAEHVKCVLDAAGIHIQ